MTSPLRKAILLALSKDTGTPKDILYNAAKKKCGTLRYKTFIHMVYLLKRDSQVVKVKRLFYLAPEGYVYKYQARKKKRVVKKEVLDYRDFFYGEYLYCKM